MDRLTSMQVARKKAIVKKLEDVITEANAFIEEIHNEQDLFFDERSEKWQEGEKGQAYQAWMDQWDTEIEDVSNELESLPDSV